MISGLVEQVEGEIEQIDADGAYDTRHAYEVTAARETRLVVPPGENAVPWDKDHPQNAVLEQVVHGAWRNGRKSRAIIDVVSRKTPCTVSSSCLAITWPRVCLKPRSPLKVVESCS